MDVADLQKPKPGELFVDHVSHFVVDLDLAARAFEELGMKVTPTSVQTTAEGPVGASNRCVMLQEGYIELLSPTADTPSAQRLRAYMEKYAGVHLVCFGTPDAEDERKRLEAHGFQPQLVAFERKVQGGMARFKAVRVPPETMPEGRIQYVQQLAPEHVWLPGFINSRQLDEVYVVARDPIEAAARWGRFAALIPSREKDCVRLQTARGSIVIGDRAAVARILGEAPPSPGIAGYSLRGNGSSAGRTIALPPALGGVLQLKS
jgi:Glyoxalase-like domain